MLGTGLVVVHNSQVSGEDDDTELTGWEDGVDKVLEVLQLEVESWRDDTTLVESSVEVDNDLASTGIINNFELVDVSMLLHDLEELDENLGGWSQDNLKQHKMVSHDALTNEKEMSAAYPNRAIHPQSPIFLSTSVFHLLISKFLVNSTLHSNKQEDISKPMDSSLLNASYHPRTLISSRLLMSKISDSTHTC